MNYDWTQSLIFAIIQKPMEKSYRVWERDVNNAVHFGTLGHRRCGRYCVRL